MTNLDKVHLCYINPKRIQITLFQKCYPNKTTPSITKQVPLKNTTSQKFDIETNIAYLTHHHMKLYYL